jgi:hypothetical protein
MDDSEWKADIATAIMEYPLLQPYQNNGDKHLQGWIEVVDNKSGILIDEYEIDLYYPEEYPFCFPKVIEKSRKIPREVDRHTMPKSTELCLAVNPEERLVCRNGITTLWFLDNVLVPRLAEEYAVSKGHKYLKEYSHGSDGIWEYFMKQFETDNTALVLNFIEGMAFYKLPKGFEPCICGSGKKFKKCHRNIVFLLNNLGSKYLLNIAKYLRSYKYTGGNLNN